MTSPEIQFAGATLGPISAQQTRCLRRSVLRPTQPPEACVYPADEEPRTAHWGIHYEGRLVGVASLFEESRPGRASGWRIRGMAVAPEQQGLGVGAALLEACLAYAKEQGGEEVWCNARTSAARFYGHQGFEEEGDEFELPGIGPHFVMRRGLTS